MRELGRFSEKAYGGEAGKVLHPASVRAEPRNNSVTRYTPLGFPHIDCREDAGDLHMCPAYR